MSMERWSRFLKVYDPLKAGSIDGTDTRPHDRGIERALESIYVPNKDRDSEPSKTLFVGRLNPDTTEERLHTAFSRFGEIKSLNLIRDIVTGFSKRYAFVEYELRTDAEEAYDRMYSGYIDNHTIFVDWECGRTLPKWIPRRLGGGFGGKKESGQLRFGGKDRPFKRPLIIERDTPVDQRERGGRRGDSLGRDGYKERERYGDRRDSSSRDGYRGGRDDRKGQCNRGDSRRRIRLIQGPDGEWYEDENEGGRGERFRGSRGNSREKNCSQRDGSRERIRIKQEPDGDWYEGIADSRQQVRIKQEYPEGSYNRGSYRDRDRHKDRSRSRERDRRRSRSRSRGRRRSGSRESSYHGDRGRRRIKRERDSDGEEDRHHRGSEKPWRKRKFTEVKREEDS